MQQRYKRRVPRPKGSADLLSDRRRRALALLKSGLSLNEVARRIQCVASSVLRWRNARRRGGADALQVGSSPGRPLKLKATQQRRLLRLLLKGPLAHGYNTNVWTTARVAEVIRREFGVSYHRDHVGRLMHSLNWSHQKPEKRASERNQRGDQALEEEGMAARKKRCVAGRPHRLCRPIRILVDPECGQDLGRLEAKHPCIGIVSSRDKISVISGVSVSPRRQHLSRAAR